MNEVKDNRNEFIEQFQREKGFSSKYNFQNTNMDNNIKSERWNELYNLNKIKQDKLREQIEEKKRKDEEDLIHECTFTPKINKNLGFSDSFSITNNNYSKNDSSYYLDYFQRQEIWNQKKQNKINILSKSLNDKNMKECYFSPEINKDNYLNKTKKNLKTINILEDPESYNQYIKRLKNKRNMEEIKKRIERLTPGSGLIWDNKPKKFNLKYDYRNHSITNNLLPRSKSNSNLNLENQDDNINLMNYKNIDKNDYYEKVYLKNNFDPNFNLFTNTINLVNNHKIRNNVKKIENNNIFNKPIDYNKAIQLLHNELYSFDLLKEETF